MPPVKLGSALTKQVPDAEKRAKAHFLVDTNRGFASAQARSALDPK
jgi:dephospho-CoA kinase